MLFHLGGRPLMEPLEPRLLLDGGGADPSDLSALPFIENLGYAVSADCFYDPGATGAPEPSLETSPPPGQRPFGATYEDTSEFLSGKVYVAVVLMESNGQVDSSTQNWTADEIAKVKGEISEGLGWWQGMYAAKGFTGALEFDVDFTYADAPFSTDYEPITRPSTNQYLWINQFLAPQGYGGGYWGLKEFDDDQRVARNDDWAYTVFVVDSSADPDGAFSDGYFAYGYLGGPFLVMTYGNGGWGIDSMGMVLAHETGHIFYALDESPSPYGRPYTDHSGYYGTQNLNAYDGNPNPSARVDSLMAEASKESQAYANHTSSPSSLEMVGWRDSDGDHIIDVLDRPLTLTGAAGSYNAASGKYTFSASSAVQTLPTANPNSAFHDITLNEVDYLQYRVDAGAWANVNASPYRVYVKTLSNVQITLPPEWQTVEFRTISGESQAASAAFSDSAARYDVTPPVVTAISLNGHPGETASDIEAGGIGVRSIAVTFNEPITFTDGAVVVQAVTFTGGDETLGQTFTPLDVTGSGSKTITATFAAGSIVDTWVRVWLNSQAIVDVGGNAMDGEPKSMGSGHGYIFDAVQDLPSGDGVAGGDAVFYVGSLRGDFNGDRFVTDADLPSFAAAWLARAPDADFRGTGFGSTLPDGRVTLCDADAFTSVYEAATAVGRRLDSLPAPIVLTWQDEAGPDPLAIVSTPADWLLADVAGQMLTSGMTANEAPLFPSGASMGGPGTAEEPDLLAVKPAQPSPDVDALSLVVLRV